MTTAYNIVLNARKADRPCSGQYIEALTDDFIELKGDRCFGDDKALIGGIGLIGNIPVTIIGIEKGSETKERIAHNFGSAYPEGYRKALRLARGAEKFGRPIICFIDTAGAYPGIEAEKRGQGQAIAECLFELSTLRTPILSIVIGEGGSGGALALCQGDRIWMLEDAYFSVVSPENCANILWKDTKLADMAAGALKLTAGDLLSLNIIDKIIKGHCDNKEHKGFSDFCENLRREIIAELTALSMLTPETLINERYEKYRKIGCLNYECD